MSEIRRYRVEQWTGEGWAELMRSDDYQEADEVALAARAAGVAGVRILDAQLGRVAWSVEERTCSAC